MLNKEKLELNEVVTHRVHGVGIYNPVCKILTERSYSSDVLFLSFDDDAIPKEVSKSFIQREIC